MLTVDLSGSPPFGVLPVAECAQVRRLSIEHLSMLESLQLMGREAPGTELWLVAFGFPLESDPLTRAYLAHSWRRQAVPGVVVASAGNHGEAAEPASSSAVASPFTWAASFEPVSAGLDAGWGVPPKAAERSEVESLPAASAPDTVVVGAATSGRALEPIVALPSTGAGAEVLASAEAVCLDPKCEQLGSGSSLAAGQVAGALLFALAATQTRDADSPRQARQLLLGTLRPDRGLDLWGLLLSLDRGLAPGQARVRSWLLDLDGNGRYDFSDLQEISDRYIGAPARDASRLDLVGNELSGDSLEGAFDLDPTRTSSSETSPWLGEARTTILGREASFDETRADDFDVACYYAYTDLYQVETCGCFRGFVCGLPYIVDVVARTGDSLDGERVVSLGEGPSINGAGDVAYVARTGATSRIRIDRLAGGGVDLDVRRSPAEHGPNVELNDLGQVVFTASETGWREVRLGSVDGTSSLVARTGDGSPFRWLGEGVALSNRGRPLFSASLEGSSGDRLAAMPIDPESVDPTRLEDYHRTQRRYPAALNPDLYPTISTDETVGLTARQDDPEARQSFVIPRAAAHPLDDSGHVWGLSGAPGGDRPGIAEDGRFLAWPRRGDDAWRVSFIEIPITEATPPEVIAGGPPPGQGLDIVSLDPLERFAVQPQPGRSDRAYAFGAFATVQLDAGFTTRGFHVWTVEFTGLSGVGYGCDLVPVVAEGFIFPGLGVLTEVRGFDPLSTSGQAALWVRTAEGTEAILRVPFDLCIE